MPRPLVMGGVPVSDVPTAIALYQPTSLHPTAWGEVATLVRSTVTAFGPGDPWMAVRHLSAVARFCAWAASQYLPLETEALFTPDLVERYAQVGMPTLSPVSRGTHRSRLSAVGRAVTQRAPWPPVPKALPRSHLALPYTCDEVAGFLEIAAKQSTHNRTRIAYGLLAGGLGAGLTPGEHLVITGRCVHQDGEGTTVHLPGAKARPVPVLDAYACLMRSLAARFPDEPLVGRSGRTDQSRLSRLVAYVEVPGWLPPLSAARLRTTWMVTLLAARVPLPAFLAAAGLASTGNLIELVPHLPQLSAADAQQVIAHALSDPPGRGRTQ
ncbi:hypothetical protein [Streptomyces sp. H39-S7]|uniref:hypothetical protein n=1 Tax=Streptomyces sp. H39-S7 TaxID=3004357 RepID=UPI0022AFAA94|nr:hypothetical protein [Streptomyces sp. H39-S7]MCZ4118687.1 hypothetical protein [Streptomyces sp. H39-S7]